MILLQSLGFEHLFSATLSISVPKDVERRAIAASGHPGEPRLGKHPHAQPETVAINLWNC